MTYKLQQLQADVMALLGENARQRDALAGVDVPGAVGMLSVRIKGLLPVCGKILLQDAPQHLLGGGDSLTPRFSTCLMPCGLYAVDMELPADTVRIAEIRLKEWARGVGLVFTPDQDGWRRQWSREPGIAGSPANPLAYMSPSSAGVLVRAIGVAAPPADTASSPSLTAWRIPVADESGYFCFPAHLYPDLVNKIAFTICP